MLERSLGKGCWVDYEKIPDCPICHKPNSDDSFACCDEHELEYKTELRKKVRQVQAENSRKMWKDPEVRNRISEANIGKKHVSTGIWITNGKENKMIKNNELENYLEQGWAMGRGSNYTDKKIIYPKMAWVCNENEVLRIRAEKVEDYLKNGYITGRVWKVK